MSEKTRHTPGPWHTASTGNHQGLIISERGDNVAVSYRSEDAPLIAAAPELLEACRTGFAALSVERDLVDDKTRKRFDSPLNTMLAAIAKAEGK